jgi:hypothetical protein
VADEVHKCEARLVALRARWRHCSNKLAAAEQLPHGRAAARSQPRHQLRLIAAEIEAAEARLRAAQHRAAVVEGQAIVEEENVQNSDFGYFPPAPGMALRTNATLHMEEVAKALGLPSSLVRRGTLLFGKAAEIFMASRNAEKMLETRMVRYVRNPSPSQG